MYTAYTWNPYKQALIDYCLGWTFANASSGWGGSLWENIFVL